MQLARKLAVPSHGTALPIVVSRRFAQHAISRVTADRTVSVRIACVDKATHRTMMQDVSGETFIFQMQVLHKRTNITFNLVAKVLGCLACRVWRTCAARRVDRSGGVGRLPPATNLSQDSLASGLAWRFGGLRYMRGWRSTVGNLIEFVRLKKAYHRPHVIGICVKHRGVRFHRIRDFKQYCLNSIPPTSHYSSSFALVILVV